MSDHRYKKIKPPPAQPPRRFSDAVRQWGDAWQIGAPGGSAMHWERTHDATDFMLMKLMEQGTIGRVA